MPTFPGVVSSSACVPLACAFLATQGRQGPATALLREGIGRTIHVPGFDLLGVSCLTLTCVYFQIPLMILIVTPAPGGAKRASRDSMAQGK